MHIHHCSRAEIRSDAIRSEGWEPRPAEGEVIPIVSPAIFAFVRRAEANQLRLEPVRLSLNLESRLRQIAIGGKAEPKSLWIEAWRNFQGLTDSETCEALAEVNEQEA